MAAVTCPQIRELFSARVDDALSAEERARVDAHLAGCVECAREWQRFESVVGLLHAVEPARAPTGFVERVLVARPRSWYRRLARGLLVPWPVKLPLEAAALVLVAGLAVMVVRHTPELEQTARAPSAVTAAPPALPSTPVPTDTSQPRPPSIVLAPAEENPEAKLSPGGPRRTGPTSNAPEPRAPAASREAATARDAAPASPPAVAEPPAVASDRQAKTASAAKGSERPDATARFQAERDEARAAGREAATRAPAPRTSGDLANLAAAEVQARLVVVDRAAAERAVRELATRASAQVVSRTDDETSTVLTLTVPGERWDDLRRGLESLGTLRVDGPHPGRAGPLRVALRLER